MKMSKGILVFARNNGVVDYIKQAKDLAFRTSKHLNLPVSIVTDKESIEDQDLSCFDNVIFAESSNDSNYKTFYDGSGNAVKVKWKNDFRTLAYDLTPYDETIILDTDIVICNDNFLQCFAQENNFLIYKKCFNLVDYDTGQQFAKLSDTSVDFYWASAVFFRKTQENKIFFDLLKHIQQNWHHYRRMYCLDTTKLRNDFIFSIGIHIMNGFQLGDFAKDMPGTLYYITDKSILYSMKEDRLKFLLEKPTYKDSYTPLGVKNINVHVMNKFSLDRCINEQ